MRIHLPPSVSRVAACALTLVVVGPAVVSAPVLAETIAVPQFYSEAHSSTSDPRQAPETMLAPLAALGDGLTGVQVQNSGEAGAAGYDLRFTSASGTTLSTVGPMQPGGSTNRYLPSLLAPGLYSALAETGGPMQGIARVDWPAHGGSAMYSSAPPALDVVLPIVFKNIGGLNSVVSILSTESRAALVDLLYTPADGAGAPITATVAIAASAATHLHLPNQPSLGRSFMGSLKVSSPVRVVVSTAAENANSEQGVVAYEGIPLEHADAELNVALFRSNQHPVMGNPATGTIDTAFAVANPMSASVTVQATYHGADISGCRNTETVGLERTIPAGGVIWVRQSDLPTDDMGSIPSLEGLPADCFGSAVLSASGPIVATVIDSQNYGQHLAAFNATPGNTASTVLDFPLYRADHVGYSTGMTIMNASTVEAIVRLELSQLDGSSLSCEAGCSVTVPPKRVTVIWPARSDGPPSSFIGSMRVVSTQPVTGIANDYNISTGDMSTYNGVPGHLTCTDCVFGLPWLPVRVGFDREQ